jgi:tetratricopeptide (TPR) repeat protein
VSEANQRTALAALNQVRPTISRLDISRHPEDVAADLIEAWNGTEIGLRSLIGGSALAGQALIRELRQREMLTLSQAHALIEFLAARDRAGRTDYQPTAADIAAARHGFQELEAGLSAPAAPPIPSAAPASASYSPGVLSPTPATRGPGRMILVAVAVLLLLGVGGFFAYQQFRTDHMQEGQRLLLGNDRDGARRAFEEAARDDENAAGPHIFLGRMARDDGDYAAARREFDTAIRLEPNNYLAHREMGKFLFLRGNYPLARNFFSRALEANPNDKSSAGYLGCSLVRMGQAELAARFFQRAGPGDWSSCIPRLPPS